MEKESMDSAAKKLLMVGGVLAFLAVAMGAFGAHGLKSAMKDWAWDAEKQLRMLEIWETAARYQMYHALALLVLGVIAMQNACRTMKAAGVLLVIGVAIFSGSLYALVLTDTSWLGAITPLGGAALLAGWVAFVIGVVRLNR